MSRNNLGLALAVLGLATALHAGEPHFERIGPSRGLRSGAIIALWQDRVGFVWIGTREGLVRYDGYGFESFRLDVEDPTTIAGNQVRAILEDREGRLWVGTNGGGLDYLDRATWTFVHHRHDPKNAGSLIDDGVFALHEDREGGIWVGTQRGTTRLDPAKGTFEVPRGDAAARPVLESGWGIALLEDRDGGMWIGSFGGGVLHRPPGDPEFHVVPVVDAPAYYRSNRVRCLVQDAAGRVWAGVAGGLLRYDARAGVLHAVEIPREFIAVGGLPTASALDVDSRGRLWIGTPGGGLIEMDPDTLRGKLLHHRRDDENSLSSDDVEAMHRSHDGSLWVGTGEGGLDLLRPDAELFTVLRAQEDDSSPGLSSTTAAVVAEDVDGRLWVGTLSRGFDIVDLESGSIRRLGNAPVKDTGERAITAVYPARDGGVWAGTPIGLVRIDRDGRVVRWWRASPDAGTGLGPGYLYAVLERRDGSVWIGTAGSGLYRMRTDRSGFERVPSESHVNVLAEGTDGTLWIGTRSAGLSVLPPGTEVPRRYLDTPGDLDALARHEVSSILEDRAGRVWIGTAGGGMYRVVRGTAGVEVKRFGERAGLVDSNVSSIVEDDDGSLWIATRGGLARFDPNREVFATWGIDDGLPSDTFQRFAGWGGRSTLSFMTSAGLVSIRRGTPFPELDPSPTTLTSLRTLSGPVRSSRPVWEVETVDIPYGEVLFVDFAVLDFRGKDRHRFAYRLGAENAPWIDVGDRRALTFTDLEPGKQLLSIRGRNANGVWSETSHPLAIRVIPPFWRTAWFRGVVLVGLVGVALGSHRVRTSRLERRNVELERLKAEREGAYDRLRALTRRLEEAKETERRNIARELHDEMGQSLSAVKINLRALGRAHEEATRSERLTDSLGLVDGMIDHVRQMSFDLRPPLLDELGLVPAVRGYAEAQSMRSGLEISVGANADAEEIPQGTAITAFRIVQEAIHNVQRHADAKRVEVSIRRDPGSLRITIRDDGTGFDLEAALARAATGHHLGLLGMRERVEALGGSLEIETRTGAGTEIRAAVPLGEDEVRT